MVIYAFEKLGIISSVIIFPFKEPVSDINTQSPSVPHIAFVVFSHLLFFSLSFQGFCFCFQSATYPETHTMPDLSGFCSSFSLYLLESCFISLLQARDGEWLLHSPTSPPRPLGSGEGWAQHLQPHCHSTRAWPWQVSCM